MNWEEYDGVQHGPPPGELVPCGICGRNFNPQSLLKHEPICRKATAGGKRRGKFDPAAQRGLQLSASTSTKREIALAKKKGAERLSVAKKPPSWKQKHAEFIDAIRGARNVQRHVDAGGSLADLPPPKPAENPDYIQCPHCSRRFNETAAKRHIPHCAERAKRDSIKKGPAGSSRNKSTTRTPTASTTAVARRNNYKAP
eukprot:UC1_evm1s585